MGILLGRQSDRDKPRTKFKNSLFSTAKKAGHEHAGVCLNLLLAMLTDRGRELLLEERGLHPRFLENQIYATELVLQVEEWFKLESYSREEMNPKKVRAAFDHFTTRISEICDWEGSGTKTLKTHLPLHMHQYIAMWGPPTGWDSGPSESHHKTEVKLPAKNTQRREVNFTEQVSKRYHESVVIRKGQYMNQIYQPDTLLANRNRKRHHGNLFLKGARFDVGRNVRGRPAMRWISQENFGKQAFPEQVLRFICNTLLPITLFRDQQERCIHGCTEMNSTFDDDDADHVIFRAHPNYRSFSAQTCDIWYDWAMFYLPEINNFDDDESIPGRILSFVEVGELVDASGYRGIKIEPFQPHCVAQLFEDPPTSEFRQSFTENSDYSQLVQWGTLQRGLFLIPCNRVVAPAIVVPNIPAEDEDTNEPLGGFFVVSNRKEWARHFTDLILSL
eukprot:scaffold8510_cov79-Cylindrotheca_fusiformis.AAC.1